MRPYVSERRTNKNFSFLELVTNYFEFELFLILPHVGRRYDTEPTWLPILVVPSVWRRCRWENVNNWELQGRMLEDYLHKGSDGKRHLNGGWNERKAKERRDEEKFIVRRLESVTSTTAGASLTLLKWTATGLTTNFTSHSKGELHIFEP